MTTNYKRTKDWLSLAFNNLNEIIKFYEINEFAACVFRIQLTMKQLQKALIVLLGFQFRKAHEPSKILESIGINEDIKIEDKILERIKKIAILSKNIEEEGTATCYGIVIDDKLISPEEKYGKSEVDGFLDDLKKNLNIFKDLEEKGVIKTELYWQWPIKKFGDKIEF